MPRKSSNRCVSRTLSIYLVMISFVSRTVRSYYRDDVDYCSLKCKWDTLNAGCNCTPVSYCDDVLGTDKDLKNFRIWMVEVHNERRNHLALGKEGQAGMHGGVANMHTLDFCEELEHMARCLAMRCKYAFKEKLCLRTKRFENAGLNRYRTAVHKMQEKHVKGGVMQWYTEVNYIDKFLMDKLVTAYISFNDSREHFTQLSWARSTHVGCWKAWNDREEIAMLYCVYGPQGNIVGEPMLSKGEACSECGEESCNKMFKGLCGEITLEGVRVAGSDDLRRGRGWWTVWIGFGILQLISTILRDCIVFV